jgi:multiple sugar transport system ATP-binding protein
VVNELEPKDRDIAMVFQNYALYPHMSVEKNMGFSLEHRGASKAEIAERVNWAAEILGLTSLLQRRPGQLSGGQRQRVAMGRAIVRNPQVFLFDEPLSNLDAKLRVVMRGEIKSLHQRLRTTTVYVTHDQVEAMTMADRIVVMNAGRVEQVGTPIELFDRPANLFVAGFIGSPAMNFVPGELLGEGATIVGVRPEHFDIAEGGLPVTVTLVEPLGSDTQITGKVAETEIVALFHKRIAASPGDTLTLKPMAAEMHRFDSTSGARL